MANKLYEEYDVERIAISIRSNAPRKVGQREFLLTEMPSGIDDVYLEGYENGGEQGYNLGLIDGEEKVKNEEGRDYTNINADVYADIKEVEVTVDAGYYPQETIANVNVEEVYVAGHTKGYEEGLAAGGGGGDEPYDPTTVWLINDVPVAISSGIAGTTINVLFNSAGEEFVKIRHNSIALNYYRSDGTAVSVWDSLSGWKSDDYKTITFPEEITDQTLINWLDTNATLIGGGSTDEEITLSHEDMVTLVEQAQSSDVNRINDFNYCFALDNFGQYGGRVVDDMVEAEYSSPSSNPLTVSIVNYTDLYAHYFIKATDVANDGPTSSVHIEAPPQGDNSVDIVSLVTNVPCNWEIEVQGVRFTKYEL